MIWSLTEMIQDQGAEEYNRIQSDSKVREKSPQEAINNLKLEICGRA